VQPTLIIQVLNQVIKLKQHNINYINQIRFIKLLCDDCHKQLVLISESHGDLNRCTSCRGNPINTPHTFHARFAYDPRPYISHMVHVYQPFVSHQQIWTDPTALEKQGFLTTSPARRLTDLRVPTLLLSPSQPVNQ
jgi:hypothetical protein